jgi:hypothetical protein
MLGDVADFLPTPAAIDHVRPWAPLIESVCGDPSQPDGFDPFDLAALGFRETGWGFGAAYAPKGDPFGYGDRGHGFGFLQLDDRTYATAITQIRALAKIRHDTGVRRMFEVALGVLVFDRMYLASPRRTRPLAGELLRRAVFDAYNAGPGRIALLAKHDQDPDALTAGHDYGRWTIAAAESLRKAAPDLFPSAAPLVTGRSSSPADGELRSPLPEVA